MFTQNQRQIYTFYPNSIIKFNIFYTLLRFDINIFRNKTIKPKKSENIGSLKNRVQYGWMIDFLFGMEYVMTTVYELLNCWLSSFSQLPGKSSKSPISEITGLVVDITTKWNTTVVIMLSCRMSFHIYCHISSHCL